MKYKDIVLNIYKKYYIDFYHEINMIYGRLYDILTRQKDEKLLKIEPPEKIADTNKLYTLTITTYLNNIINIRSMIINIFIELMIIGNDKNLNKEEKIMKILLYLNTFRTEEFYQELYSQLDFEQLNKNIQELFEEDMEDIDKKNIDELEKATNNYEMIVDILNNIIAEIYSSLCELNFDQISQEKKEKNIFLMLLSKIKIPIN